MTTRGIGTELGNDELEKFIRTMGGARSQISTSILPALGLASAMNVVGGSFGDVTAGGRELSSVGFRLQAAFFPLQDAFARALFPLSEQAADVIIPLIDQFVDLNEQTDGWAVNAVLAAGAARVLYGPMSRLIGLAATPLGAGTIGALLAGGIIYTGLSGNEEPINNLNRQIASLLGLDPDTVPELEINGYLESQRNRDIARNAINRLGHETGQSFETFGRFNDALFRQYGDIARGTGFGNEAAADYGRELQASARSGLNVTIQVLDIEHAAEMYNRIRAEGLID